MQDARQDLKTLNAYTLVRCNVSEDTQNDSRQPGEGCMQESLDWKATEGKSSSLLDMHGTDDGNQQCHECHNDLIMSLCSEPWKPCM